MGAAVNAVHGYTTPSIMVLPVESADPDYQKWIIEETGGSSG